jgi:tRNA threonylcarbamoyladenosine biosynthesis protein TsaE
VGRGIKRDGVSTPRDPLILTLDLADEVATATLAARLADAARPGDVLALQGGLGMGKTHLARAFIRHLGGGEEVPSPTFTLVQTYDTSAGPVWHCDLYRVADATEATELGLEEALVGGILLIEWPERLGKFLPARRLDLALDAGPAPAARRAVLTPRGGSDWLGRAAPW